MDDLIGEVDRSGEVIDAGLTSVLVVTAGEELVEARIDAGGEGSLTEEAVLTTVIVMHDPL